MAYFPTFVDAIYGREGPEIWYIGGKTIKIGSCDFITKVFSAFPLGDQTNWHSLASEADCKEKAGWSEQQEVDTRNG